MDTNLAEASAALVSFRPLTSGFRTLPFQLLLHFIYWTLAILATVLVVKFEFVDNLVRPSKRIHLIMHVLLMVAVAL